MTGYAGTGKTTLLQALIARLQQQHDGRPIALTALSNKATKVLQAMAYRWGCEVDCMTCCKLLGLKPVIDKETGGQKFEPDRQFTFAEVSSTLGHAIGVARPVLYLAIRDSHPGEITP